MAVRAAAPCLVAHRGASACAPENTLAAFDLALEQGADVLELDVRVAGDGRLITLHDETLERTTGDPRRHDELTGVLEHPAAPADLEDVLARYGGAAPLIVDLKDPLPAWERRIVEAIERHGVQDRVAVQSFDHAALERLAATTPWLEVTALYRRADAEFLDIADVPAFARTVGLWHEHVDETLVAEAHERGLRVQPHTVDDAPRAAELVALGVDAVVSNHPGAIAGALRGAQCAPAPLPLAASTATT